MPSSEFIQKPHKRKEIWFICCHTLLQAIHSEKTLKCPVCCAVIEINDVATLPNNIFAQHIIHLIQQKAMLVIRRISLWSYFYLSFLDLFIFCFLKVYDMVFSM